MHFLQLKILQNIQMITGSIILHKEINIFNRYMLLVTYERYLIYKYEHTIITSCLFNVRN